MGFQQVTQKPAGGISIALCSPTAAGLEWLERKACSRLSPGREVLSSLQEGTKYLQDDGKKKKKKGYILSKKAKKQEKVISNSKITAENRNMCVTIDSSLQCAPEMQMPAAGPAVPEPQ